MSLCHPASKHATPNWGFHELRWSAWCEGHELDLLAGILRAHVELCIRSLGERGLMESSVVTMLHRGDFLRVAQTIRRLGLA